MKSKDYSIKREACQCRRESSFPRVLVEKQVGAKC